MRDVDVFTCNGCGRVTPDTDDGCTTCGLCEGCTPAEGTCEQCRAERAELLGDRGR